MDVPLQQCRRRKPLGSNASCLVMIHARGQLPITPCAILQSLSVKGSIQHRAAASPELVNTEQRYQHHLEVVANESVSDLRPDQLSKRGQAGNQAITDHWSWCRARGGLFREATFQLRTHYTRPPGRNLGTLTVQMVGRRHRRLENLRFISESSRSKEVQYSTVQQIGQCVEAGLIAMPSDKRQPGVSIVEMQPYRWLAELRYLHNPSES
nr:hypothetical protein CFP56_64835 [Quercus suber]